MAGKRVLSVGQCAADHGSLSRVLRQHYGAEVVPADTSAEALDLLGKEPFDLVLVNRILDEDGSTGMTVVGEICNDEKLCLVPVMLVSNYEDAQREARAAGALPGFGKSALGNPGMIAQLKPILG